MRPPPAGDDIPLGTGRKRSTVKVTAESSPRKTYVVEAVHFNHMEVLILWQDSRTHALGVLVLVVAVVAGGVLLVGGGDETSRDVKVTDVQMGIYTHPYSDATVARITVHNTGVSPRSVTVTARLVVLNGTYEERQKVTLQAGETRTLAMFVAGRSQMSPDEVHAQYQRNWVGEIVVNGEVRDTLEPREDRCQHLCPG